MARMKISRTAKRDLSQLKIIKKLKRALAPLVRYLNQNFICWHSWHVEKGVISRHTKFGIIRYKEGYCDKCKLHEVIFY